MHLKMGGSATDSDDIVELKGLGTLPVEPSHHEKMALFFGSVFCLAIMIHYVCVMILAVADKPQYLEYLENLFDKLLPALMTAVGADITYYFTNRERK